MKIVCVGGGPAGLYLGILLKKADPSRQVTIYERNPADQTFGFGVVFSDETLGNLLEADEPTHREIVRHFTRWEEIHIHLRGEVFRSTGHGFSGISRRSLLQILQRRAAELGVDVRFGADIDDLQAFSDVDLLVGADGIRSRVRAAHQEVFQPTVELGKSRYIWLGTHKRFDAFTFLFRETPHGLFQVHAYPFDRESSTFIVECDESTWHNAGLDRVSVEAGVRYLEDVFASWLDGNPLLSNQSSWLRFTTVKCESWRHENKVLIGDAAHTAHFSIGSGTKLAIEDAILLAQAIETQSSVREALAAFEEERRPMVARIQKAAQDSREWFEGTSRHHRADSLTMAFGLLTRSKRIGWENLEERDPSFVDRVRVQFAARATLTDRDPPAPVSHLPGASEPVPLDDHGPAPVTSLPPPMFTRFQLRELVLTNRVVVSPMCMYSATDGLVDDFHLAHIGALASGGAGLILTEMTHVMEEGRITPGCAGIYNDEQMARWRRIVDLVHRTSDAKIALQIGHAGRKGATRLMWEGMDEPLVDGGWPLVSASPLPFHPHSQIPSEMSRAQMLAVKERFVTAAKRAAEAGFDMIEIHFGHGYLLASFLSPITNVRTDEWGGSPENRMKFPLEVFAAVRRAWPQHKPMSVRISATDWVEGGFEVEDAVEVGTALKTLGCDVLDVSTGQTTPDARPVFGRMWQTKFSEQIRNEVGIPTIAVGNISSADQVNTILAAGRADLCAIGRPHLANPRWTLHAAAEQGWTGQQWPRPLAAGASSLRRRLPIHSL